MNYYYCKKSLLKTFRKSSNIMMLSILLSVIFVWNVSAEVLTLPVDLAPDTQQQGRTITGVVRDNVGPVIGANVVVKGTTNGVITDVNGQYSRSGVQSNDVLRVSFIGYITKEVNVGNQTRLDILVEEDVSALEEVVVIGYGTVRKADVTGSVGSLRTKDVGNVVVANVENMIQGRIAGVDVTNYSGLPGAGTSINIRGVGTINNSEPLYIVDGMPGNINTVSQYDIESINILKDASATAIYGARAANGVVLITTKRGVRGAPKVTLNAYAGISQAAKKLELLNADQYIDLVTEISPSFFAGARRFLPVDQGGLGYSEQWARTDRTRIQDEIFRNAMQQEYNLNISGGAENSVYSVSGTYSDMDAITQGYNYTRFILTSNMEFTIRKYIKIGQNLSVTRTNRTGRSVDYTAAIRWAPYMPLIDTENSWGYSKITSAIDGGNDTFNPLPNLYLGDDWSKQTRIREQVYVEVSLLDMFKWKTQLQYTNNANNNFNWMPYNENGNLFNQATIGESYGYSEGAMIENFLTFDKKISTHSINAMIGNTYSTSTLNNGRDLTVAGNGTTATPWENYEVLLVTRAPTQTISGNSSSHSAYLSYYGRLNYSFKDRYLFTFNYRQDASPNFSPKNRWGRFPSMALAWKLEEEGFMKQFQNISQAKLRLSWGKSGNDRINNYAYLANLFQGGSMNIVSAVGVNQDQFLGTTVNTMPAVGIRWETTTSYNVGLDVGFLNNKFTASLDVYNRLTDGILIRVPIAYSSGIDNSPYSNAAQVRNTAM
jgi:TonB-linked SusC/RagA family outer membrane protein